MKIIVLNIPRNIKDTEIKNLFSEYGVVESCSLVMDAERGMSKGFGFVEMPDAEEANAAIAALHSKQVGNQKIRVKFSQ